MKARGLLFKPTQEATGGREHAQTKSKKRNETAESDPRSQEKYCIYKKQRLDF